MAPLSSAAGLAAPMTQGCGSLSASRGLLCFALSRCDRGLAAEQRRPHRSARLQAELGCVLLSGMRTRLCLHVNTVAQLHHIIVDSQNWWARVWQNPISVPPYRRLCAPRQVGEAYAGNDNVLIAKIDATANDIPSKLFKVQVRWRSPAYVGFRGSAWARRLASEGCFCGAGALAHVMRRRCGQGALHACGALPACAAQHPACRTSSQQSAGGAAELAAPCT